MFTSRYKFGSDLKTIATKGFQQKIIVSDLCIAKIAKAHSECLQAATSTKVFRPKNATMDQSGSCKP